MVLAWIVGLELWFVSYYAFNSVVLEHLLLVTFVYVVLFVCICLIAICLLISDCVCLC